ncbi:hypothetical protein [uncultured Aquimarina sp.]|uniref:hypothetical protein n=1 Tax=uncultured Aquimarina sp. TaxID=575652 RepID=UPI00260AD3F9|nr:hypothetical protein [uncultured Aquimarina sp.]
MIFKGHFDLLKQPLDFTKTTIYSIEEGKEFIHKEYYYLNGKVIKIINYLNGVLSEYQYLNDNDFEIRFYLFEESITEKKLDSIKKISESNGIKLKENLTEIRDGKKTTVYTGTYKYSGEYLIEENYIYPDSKYIIQHNWNKDKSVCEVIHIDEPERVKYTFDKNGFLKECLNFQYEGSVKKTEYEYKDNMLFKLIEFPHLTYKKNLIGKGLKIMGKAQFMDEIEHYYSNDKLLKKEVVKDYETKEIVRETYYKYEK